MTELDERDNITTLTSTLDRQADLLIAKSSQRNNQAGLITYTVTVQNLGPSDADGTAVADPIPAGIDTFTWQCTASGGASWSVNGSGALNDTLTDFPAGGQVVYTITGDSLFITGLSDFGRTPVHYLARALSKVGYCSRSKAFDLIREGRVRLNGALVRDPETRLDMNLDLLGVDGQNLAAAEKIYIMLNKPRGVLATAADEKGRETVYGWGASWATAERRLLIHGAEK